MSDTFGDISGKNEAARTPCRVAYTINNTQPVISTIIGDQPLFYMDFDYAYEDVDDMSFDAADMKILEGEINTLKDEIQSLEKLSQNFATDSADKVEQFLADADFVTQAHEEREEDIDAILETLRESRLATAYLAKAEEHGVSLKYSRQVQSAQYDRDAGLILINPDIQKADQLLLAAQELRRHWQHRQGALIHPLMFHPDNAVLIHRSQVADLVVSIIRVAWELQLSGLKEAWERIENSTLADLGRAFAREAFLDFRTINNGQAAAAVFESWFLSERCRAQDKILINQMLADYKGYVFDLEEAEQNVTPTLIAALGEMPFGKNYLAEHALTIMDDAIFTDVRDRSNANFLWFIKFERSFRETEQALQPNSGTSAEDIRSSVPHSQLGNEYHGFNETPFGAQEDISGEVVHLFEAQGDDLENGDKSKKTAKRLAPKDRSERRTNKGDTSNVIYIRHQPPSGQ